MLPMNSIDIIIVVCMFLVFMNAKQNIPALPYIVLLFFFASKETKKLASHRNSKTNFHFFGKDFAK